MSDCYLVARIMTLTLPFTSSRSRESPEAIMEMLRASPSELALLKQNNPVLGEAFEKGLEEFAKVKTKSSVHRYNF